MTPKDNSNKRKTSRFIEYKGEVKTMSQWAEVIGIKAATFHARLKAGWDIEKIIKTPSWEYHGRK